MSKLGAQTGKYQLNALVAIDPQKHTHLLKHLEGFPKYSDKLKFDLQLKLNSPGNFMTDSERHASASVHKPDLKDGLMEDSMVARKIGLLMWSTDNTNNIG